MIANVKEINNNNNNNNNNNDDDDDDDESISELFLNQFYLN